MSRAHKCWSLVSLVALSALAVGCNGGGQLKVEGKLQQNGTPVTHSGATETLLVTFKSADAAGGRSFTPAVAEATGAFTLAGGDGKGIPAGTYTVEVTCVPYGPPKPGRQGDRFQGRFAVGKSPLSVEIKPETKSVTIDVGKGTATAS